MQWEPKNIRSAQRVELSHAFNFTLGPFELLDIKAVSELVEHTRSQPIELDEIQARTEPTKVPTSLSIKPTSSNDWAWR